MKKFIVILIATFAVAISASAMRLEEAFRALTEAPNVSLKVNDAPSTIKIDSMIDKIGPFKVASAGNLNATQILETGNAIYRILNQVPLTHMINGANNQLAAAFLYATPNSNGKYDFLLVSMSGYAGDVTIIYTTIDEATKNAFQNAKVTLEGAKLSLIPENIQGSSAFRIILNVPKNLIP